MKYAIENMTKVGLSLVNLVKLARLLQRGASFYPQYLSQQRSLMSDFEKFYHFDGECDDDDDGDDDVGAGDAGNDGEG
jgi:hypothetical protein